ncbi:MAG: hypothetical protein K6E99_02830 [Bacilli bacterium]|nr:hypothetical protein [Bacilli bacterium]
MFHDEKWSPLVTKLTWSHFITVMPLKDDNEIMFYLENIIARKYVLFNSI